MRSNWSSWRFRWLRKSQCSMGQLDIYGTRMYIVRYKTEINQGMYSPPPPPPPPPPPTTTYPFQNKTQKFTKTILDNIRGDGNQSVWHFHVPSTRDTQDEKSKASCLDKKLKRRICIRRIRKQKSQRIQSVKNRVSRNVYFITCWMTLKVTEWHCSVYSPTVIATLVFFLAGSPE